MQQVVELAERGPGYDASNPSHGLDLKLNVDGAQQSASVRWERVSRCGVHDEPVEGNEALEDFDALVARLEELEAS